mmetsp:Transcript_23362/g.83447  ORF Transcript_23362/g.83447 Transcript_23362/m.83447 type:complete len:217 (+) Transcript_23362:247-897(+)
MVPLRRARRVPAGRNRPGPRRLRRLPPVGGAGGPIAVRPQTRIGRRRQLLPRRERASICLRLRRRRIRRRGPGRLRRGRRRGRHANPQVYGDRGRALARFRRSRDVRVGPAAAGHVHLRRVAPAPGTRRRPDAARKAESAPSPAAARDPPGHDCEPDALCSFPGHYRAPDCRTDADGALYADADDTAKGDGTGDQWPHDRPQPGHRASRSHRSSDG